MCVYTLLKCVLVAIFFLSCRVLSIHWYTPNDWFYLMPATCRAPVTTKMHKDYVYKMEQRSDREMEKEETHSNRFNFISSELLWISSPWGVMHSTFIYPMIFPMIKINYLYIHIKFRSDKCINAVLLIFLCDHFVNFVSISRSKTFSPRISLYPTFKSQQRRKNEFLKHFFCHRASFLCIFSTTTSPQPYIVSPPIAICDIKHAILFVCFICLFHVFWSYFHDDDDAVSVFTISMPTSHDRNEFLENDICKAISTNCYTCRATAPKKRLCNRLIWLGI